MNYASNPEPDFDEMVALIDKIFDLAMKKASLDLVLDCSQADIVARSQVDPEYFVNGKVPSMEFVKNSYMVTGRNGELVELKTKLVEISASLDRAKAQLNLMKDYAEVWRTKQANERQAVL